MESKYFGQMLLEYCKEDANWQVSEAKEGEVMFNYEFLCS
jgi:hypothetical protein